MSGGKENRRRSMLGPIQVSSLNVMTKFVGPHLPTGTEIPVHCQSPQWEVLAIPMIPKIKHARKARAGMTDFLPRSVLHLPTKKKLHPTRDAEGINRSSRHQGH